MKTASAPRTKAVPAPRENPQDACSPKGTGDREHLDRRLGGPSTAPVLPRSAQDDKEGVDGAGAKSAVPVASIEAPAKSAASILAGFPKPVPGLGCAPDREGLYWVNYPEVGRMIACCEGVAPFLRVFLLDPWEIDAPRLKPTTKEMESIVWEGEVALPTAVKGGAR